MTPAETRNAAHDIIDRMREVVDATYAADIEWQAIYWKFKAANSLALGALAHAGARAKIGKEMEVVG